MPRRPQKTSLADDRMIVSLVEKNPLAMVGQMKNTLQEAGGSASKSTITRRLHWSRSRGFTIGKSQK